MNGQLALLGTMASQLGQTNDKIGQLSTSLEVLPVLDRHIDNASAEIKVRVRRLVGKLDQQLSALPAMEQGLKDTNAGINAMQTSLGSVSTSINGMQSQLGVLTPMNEKLGVLTPMNESLKAMSGRINHSALLGL